MQEDDHMFDYISIMNLTYFKVHVIGAHVLVALFESLLPSHEYLMTTFETRPIEELTIEFITL